MRTAFELADVVKEFGNSLITETKLTSLHIKTLKNIVGCRTALFGGHEEVCDTCGTIRYAYNSCGDRHCPKCQAAKQAFWVEDLMQSTLPIKHFHLVFTAPHVLNALCLHNQRLYYHLFFDAVWHTLRLLDTRIMESKAEQ